jgi:hypothetical protein
METVKITTSICPHFVKDEGRGHYIICRKLFRNGAPILAKQQFVGFNGFLFVTVGHPGEWNSVFKMSQYVTQLDGRPVTWLGSANLYTYSQGFRAYIPEYILKAKEPGRIESVGIFRKHTAPKFEIYYLELPKITAEVLLGRKELN